jgi:hypothetical protein
LPVKPSSLIFFVSLAISFPFPVCFYFINS